jgi:hypothetical protein
MSGKNTIEPTIKERLDKLVSDWNEVCAKLSASNREPCDALVFRQNSNHIWKSLVLLEKGNDCKGPLSEAIQKFESIILKKQKEVYSTILGIDEELMDKLKKEQTELSNEIDSTSGESTHKFTIGSAVKMIDEGIGIIIEARDDDYGFKILYDGLFISWFLTSKLKLIKSDTKPTTKKVFDLLSGYFEFVKSSSRLSEVKMASVTELII